MIFPAMNVVQFVSLSALHTVCIPSSFYPSRKWFLKSAGHNTWPYYDNWEVFSHDAKQHLPHRLCEDIDIGPTKIFRPLR